MTTFTTFATATFASGNIVVVQSAENMVPGLPITFAGNTFGNVTANATYYIGNISFGFPTSNITLTSLPGGATYALANGSGSMTANFTQGGQIIIPTVPPGEPLNQAFDAINVNFDQIFAAGPVGSNIQIDENTIYTLNTNGNLVLNPNGIGNVIANAHVIPDRDRARNLGAANLRWNTVYAQNFVGNGQGISNVTVSNISNGSTNVTALANGNVAITVAGVSNVAVFTVDGLLIEGAITSSGNVTAPTFVGNLVGNITGNIDAGGSNTQIQFNDDDLLAGSPGFTFDKISNSVSVTGTLTAGNLLTPGIVSSVGGVYGDIYTTLIDTGDSSALIVVPDVNILSDVAIGQSLEVAGQVSVTGNVTANYYYGNGSQLTGITADNVNADDLIGNTLSGNVLYSSLIEVGNLTSLNVVGTTTAGNIETAGSLSAAGNVIGGNLLFGSGVVSGTGNIYANKIFANIQGNIDAAGNLYEIQFNTVGDQLGANANFTYDSSNNVFSVAGGNIVGGNVIIGNILIPDTGNVLVGNVNINYLAEPVANSDAATKFYVDSVAANVLPIITNQTITPDGSSSTFNLNQATAAVGLLVTINGITQTPNVDYTVTGNTISLGETPLPSDIIQIRYLSGTSTGGGGTMSKTKLLNHVTPSGNVTGPGSVGTWSANYTAGGGAVEVTAQITASANVTGDVTYELQRNGSTVDTASFYFNQSSVHMVLPTLCWITNSESGTNTYSIRIGSGMIVDSNDTCLMVITEY